MNIDIAPIDRNRGEEIAQGAQAQLDAALHRLEKTWQSVRGEASQQLEDHMQRAEQRIQALEVQLAYWKGEAEKALAQLTQQKDIAARLARAESGLADQKMLARQWQEKADSWKEEARRAEKARIAAIHNASTGEVKTIVAEIHACLDEAIGNIQEVVAGRKAGRGN